MRRLSIAILAAVVVVPVSIAGCNGNGDDAPDAAPINICGAAVATISTYPGMFAGTPIGAGADLAVAEGACTDEVAWFGADGDDQVINLTGLRADATYVVELATTDDLSFYVASACDTAGPVAGACLLHVDASVQDEIGNFVAPAGGQVALIIDSFMNPAPPATGMYTVTVREAECDDNPDCTDPARPICDAFACVQCASTFDCPSATSPVCDLDTNTCGPGPALCTGDDGNEDDDGPAAATMIAVPTMATPTVAIGAVCNTPPAEADWYTFTLTARTGIRIDLTYDTTDPASDIDVYLLDADAGLLGAGENLEGIPEAFIADLFPGTYSVLVRQFGPDDNVAAVMYTLTLSIPECVTAFECLDPTQPVCNQIGECEAGPANCTVDDAADGGTGDDGPAAATLIGAGMTSSFNRSLCEDVNESDWFRAVMVQGQGLTISVDSVTNTDDFDVYAMDATGEFVGFSFWVDPETVTLTYLPAGNVYIQVLRFTPFGPAASNYAVTFTRTTATPALCATSAHCAAEFETQIYRGQCTAGACGFIPPGTRAAGAPCDNAADCMSQLCSYAFFEADAQDSVCTIACAQTADCTAVGAGLACTTGFVTNVCTPSCTSDLECGARVGNSMIDAGQPWNYFTCTTASGVCSP